MELRALQAPGPRKATWLAEPAGFVALALSTEDAPAQGESDTALAGLASAFHSLLAARFCGAGLAAASK